MYGVLHSEAHVCVWYCSAKEQVLALQYHTQTPLTWPSIHHIKYMLTHKKYLTSFVKNEVRCRLAQPHNQKLILFFMANGHIFYRKVFLLVATLCKSGKPMMSFYYVWLFGNEERCGGCGWVL